jgi:hypothetical protein
MAIRDVEDLYEKYVRPLSADDKRELVKLTAEDLNREGQPRDAAPRRASHSLLELEGLGEELWRGIDAQEYVNELRREWDHRP